MAISGVNIFPVEIEAVLIAVPGVRAPWSVRLQAFAPEPWYAEV